MDINRVVLLLTASINVNNLADVIVNPDQRRHDYIESLKYYLANLPNLRRIIFAENSAADLSPIHAAIGGNTFGKSLEFLSFSLNEFPREYHKGYGEQILMEAAIDKSNLLQGDDVITKITGRLRVLNLEKIIASMADHLDLYCDFRDHPFFDWLALPWASHYCDTRLLLFSKRFFDENLRGCARNHNTGGFSLEGTYYSITKPIEKNPSIRSRFSVEPHFVGTAGHWANKIKRTVRAILRKTFPRIKV
jgi:hypothetical protein